MTETLADLFREVGIRPAWEAHANARPARPMPRVMRPIEQRMRDANQGVRTQAQAQRDSGALLADQSQRGEAFTPPRNQVAEAGQHALEFTGLPSVRRSARAFASGDPATGAGEAALGALGVLGMGTLPGVRGARPAASAPQAPRLPNAPPRLPGRATDGSVLPVRPPEPIRNSMRGGSEDLTEAARMRPDAGGAQGGQLGAGNAPRTYSSGDTTVTVRPRDDGLHELEWDMVEGPQTLSIADRAASEAAGVDATLDALRRDSAANPNATYYFEPATRALERRYKRMAPMLAEQGFRMRYHGNGYTLHRFEPPNASPPRPPPMFPGPRR